jgi:hypothetical protein
VKITTITALLFTFLFFLAAFSQSEEHYIYKDGQGKLVISNQRPPAGSTILRTMDLPEFREAPTYKVQDMSTLPSTAKVESSLKRDQKQ